MQHFTLYYNGYNTIFNRVAVLFKLYWSKKDLDNDE